MNRSVIVHGPQGCGKTRNAVALARHFRSSTTRIRIDCRSASQWAA